MKRLCLVGLALSACVAAAADKGGDWPLFRGNALQNGVSAEALPDKLTQLWTFESKDSIEGAPAVVAGTVYLASMDENLYALDLATGKEKWRYHAGAFKASPSVRDGAVYIGDGDGKFHCVDATTGKGRWSFETKAEITAGANFAGELVLFGSYDETLYALEAATGVEKWHFKTNGPFNGAPAVAEGYTFVAGCDSTVHVLDAKTGKEKTAVDLGSQSGATAAVAGDFLYAGTMGNDIQAIDWKKGTVAWRFQPEKRAQPFYASAAVTGDLVLAGSRDRKLYALNRKDGSEKWNFATRNRVECSPVVAGKRIYFGSLDENLYVLDLDGKKVEVIKLDGAVSGSPAAAEGRLLIGTQKGTLYCFGGKGK